MDVCISPEFHVNTATRLASHQLFLAVICEVVDAGDDGKSTETFILTNFDLDGSGI